jgi:hypothetical protein
MESNLLKTENPNLLKDQESNALLSTNVKELNRHKQIKANAENQKRQESDLNNIKSEVSGLKQELGEIKGLLSKLLNQ